MSEQMVRGAWLISGAKFLRTRYSGETSERLLAALSKPLRASLAELSPAHWYPRAHHVEILKAIASVHRDEASTYDSLLAYGQLTATDMTGGSWRPLFRILTPKLFAKKLPNLWASDHQDDGQLESDIAQVEEARLPLRLSAIQGYESVGVVTLGWVRGLLTALGRKDISVKQSGWSLTQPAPNEMTCEVRWS